MWIHSADCFEGFWKLPKFKVFSGLGNINFLRQKHGWYLGRYENPESKEPTPCIYESLFLFYPGSLELFILWVGPLLPVPVHPQDHRQGEGREAEAVPAPWPPGMDIRVKERSTLFLVMQTPSWSFRHCSSPYRAVNSDKVSHTK